MRVEAYCHWAVGLARLRPVLRQVHLCSVCRISRRSSGAREASSFGACSAQDAACNKGVAEAASGGHRRCRARNAARATKRSV